MYINLLISTYLQSMNNGPYEKVIQGKYSKHYSYIFSDLFKIRSILCSSIYATKVNKKNLILHLILSYKEAYYISNVKY